MIAQSHAAGPSGDAVSRLLPANRSSPGIVRNWSVMMLLTFQDTALPDHWADPELSMEHSQVEGRHPARADRDPNLH